MMTTPLETALAKIGNNQSEMARICGVSQPTVWAWIKGKKRLPAEHVLAVEAETGISRHALRPDIYPIEHHANVAVCSLCDMRAEQPQVRACTATDCPMRARDAA